MKVRQAQINDAKAICKLINDYAEQGKMLHRSLENVYDCLREFAIAEDESGSVVGCVAVDIFWADLAEIKSLAVAPGRTGGGVGSMLLAAGIDDARALGVKRLFALTSETRFFERRGFTRIDRETLPEKVWRECIACPKADACDEVAMMLNLNTDQHSGQLASTDAAT